MNISSRDTRPRDLEKDFAASSEEESEEDDDDDGFDDDDLQKDKDIYYKLVA